MAAIPVTNVGATWQLDEDNKFVCSHDAGRTVEEEEVDALSGGEHHTYPVKFYQCVDPDCLQELAGDPYQDAEDAMLDHELAGAI